MALMSLAFSAFVRREQPGSTNLVEEVLLPLMGEGGERKRRPLDVVTPRTSPTGATLEREYRTTSFGRRALASILLRHAIFAGE